MEQLRNKKSENKFCGLKAERRKGRDVSAFFCFNNEGMSLLEVIVASAIFSLIGAAMISMSLGGFNALQRGGDQTAAAALAEEGMEAVRSIRDGAWNEIIYSQSAVEISGGQWIFTGEGTNQIIGKYTRTITIADVCRDGNDDIADCPGSYLDIHSKKITCIVTWSPMEGVIDSIERVSYLSNWDSTVWQEDLEADFNSGTFSGTATTTSFGDLDGAIILEVL